MIMRITQGGIYVMVQKYGLEGLLVVEKGKTQCNPEKEKASVDGREYKVFDRVQVMIRAQMVEFRRSVVLVYHP
jgi:hypothetical protein